MNIIEWLENKLNPIPCSTEDFIYNDLESQSNYSLPIIYQPFDYKNKAHWADRGSLFDYLYSVGGQNKILLDFGPGDGWPSLIVAPYVKQVFGIDASIKRVEVCKQNAKRLGITNTKFFHYFSGDKLPFPDNFFDGIMAASSIEQTPNPKEILKELYRVLKPGGKIRIKYEALNMYKNGRENDLWLAEINQQTCKLILYFRNIEKEYTIQYALTISLSKEKLVKLLNKVSFERITIDFLESIKPLILNAQSSKLKHPSGTTYSQWLKEVGFKEILPTHSGADVAVKIFEQYSEKDLPTKLDIIDEIIKPVVKIAVQLTAPIESDPMITAVK